MGTLRNKPIDNIQAESQRKKQSIREMGTQRKVLKSVEYEPPKRREGEGASEIFEGKMAENFLDLMGNFKSLNQEAQ